MRTKPPVWLIVPVPPSMPSQARLETSSSPPATTSTVPLPVEVPILRNAVLAALVPAVSTRAVPPLPIVVVSNRLGAALGFQFAAVTKLPAAAFQLSVLAPKLVMS
jgi:hypothetical protein